MEQLHVAEERKVAINYADKGFPPTVEKLRPVVFREGTAFYCLLGPDLQTGIFGYGDTEREALVDWDKNLQLKLKHLRKDDPVLSFVLTKLRPRGVRGNTDRHDFHDQL